MPRLYLRSHRLINKVDVEGAERLVIAFYTEDESEKRNEERDRTRAQDLIHRKKESVCVR